jgi:hypothetical protein
MSRFTSPAGEVATSPRRMAFLATRP